MDFDQPDDTSRLLPIENQEKGGGSCHHKTTDPHEKKNTIHTHPDADVVVGQQQDDPRLICVWYFLCHYVYSRAKEKKTKQQVEQPVSCCRVWWFLEKQKMNIINNRNPFGPFTLCAVLCALSGGGGEIREKTMSTDSTVDFRSERITHTQTPDAFDASSQHQPKPAQQVDFQFFAFFVYLFVCQLVDVPFESQRYTLIHPRFFSF